MLGAYREWAKLATQAGDAKRNQRKKAATRWKWADSCIRRSSARWQDTGNEFVYLYGLTGEQ